MRSRLFKRLLPQTKTSISGWLCQLKWKFEATIFTESDTMIENLSSPLLEIENLSVQLGGKIVLDQIGLRINHNEQWAITGPSGSGKTVLAQTIAGEHFHSGNIKYHFYDSVKSQTDIVLVHQQHRFRNLSNRNEFYYQQRFNSTDAEDAMTVAQELAISDFGDETILPGFKAHDIPDLMRISQLLNEPLIHLSNGENKRLQIARALLRAPQLLILDNPFTGLDADGRNILHSIINRLAQAGVNILLIAPPTELPSCITHIAIFAKGRLVSALPKNEMSKSPTANKKHFSAVDHNILSQLKQASDEKFEYAIIMRKVNLNYGGKMILHNINWEVKKGERWSLSGPNGAGKSSLLSLITGDNPQAYANEIYLFDRRRGSGESIWDIKRRIGYGSPEMHLYFDYSANCFETIASGYFDSIGLFRKLSHEQELRVMQWMQALNMQDIQNKKLSEFSAGQQRLILLARALVKNPPLLILDEPCQGLDEEQENQFRTIVTEVCDLFNTTLVYTSHYKEQIPESVNKHLELNKGIGTIRY